jgi:hypothetical protein
MGAGACGWALNDFFAWAGCSVEMSENQLPAADVDREMRHDWLRPDTYGWRLHAFGLMPS